MSVNCPEKPTILYSLEAAEQCGLASRLRRIRFEGDPDSPNLFVYREGALALGYDYRNGDIELHEVGPVDFAPCDEGAPCPDGIGIDETCSLIPCPHAKMISEGSVRSRCFNEGTYRRTRDSLRLYADKLFDGEYAEDPRNPPLTREWLSALLEATHSYWEIHAPNGAWLLVDA
jgi:hypothetical protein